MGFLELGIIYGIIIMTIKVDFVLALEKKKGKSLGLSSFRQMGQEVFGSGKL